MRPDLEVKKLEYSAAQDMLKHYDTLNWQIGSILIAGVVVLTGLVVNQDTVELMHCSREVARALTIGLPGMSLMILSAWCHWFLRHRDLYNFRNETLHRIEAQLGMYHFLRVAEAKLTKRGRTSKALPLKFSIWRARAGHDDVKPLYPNKRLSGLSGATLVILLTLTIPSIQYFLLRALSRTTGAGQCESAATLQARAETAGSTPAVSSTR